MTAGSQTTDDTTPLLQVDDLAVHFHINRGLFRSNDVVRAVDGVSFTLNRSETLGIVGESGCGKSTLGRAVLQLLKPSQGSVVWLGQDLTKADTETMRRLRKDLQIIFQDPLASLDPRMTIGDIIDEPLMTHFPELSRSERRERVRSIMDRVGLREQMINRYPHEFSGGQAQRIGIARAMILSPQLIVCDEPVSALDVSIQAQIVNLLTHLQREFALSLVFISHDLSVVRHISHRIAVMYLGKLVEIADRNALFAKQHHPYTKALISAVPVPDPRVERSRQRVVLVGDLPSPIDPPSGCRFRTRCPIAQAPEIQKVCATAEPPLTEVAPGHRAACHFWQQA